MKRFLSRFQITDQMVMVFFSLIAIIPVLIIIMNSFKQKVAIFRAPYNLPDSQTFSLIGYQTVNEKASFGLYYFNSIVVTGCSILFVILFGSMVAFAFSQYQFKYKKILRVFFLLGILIPIRLGSVTILLTIKNLHLIDTLVALILVYIAQGLPMAILILAQFMETIPHELLDAARIDGANEFMVYRTIMPLIYPALGTVSAFSMLPIWNDLWFPLILIYTDKNRTVTLGTLQFMGQYSSDWNALLAALTISIVPVLLTYFLFSHKILGNMTLGAIK